MTSTIEEVVGLLGMGGMREYEEFDFCWSAVILTDHFRLRAGDLQQSKNGK